MSEKIIKVKVSAGAKTENVKEIGHGVFKIRVMVPPEKGKANLRVIELIARHLGVSKSRVVLKSGEKNREKVFSIKI